MKSTVYLFFLFIGSFSFSYAQRLTDWQTENVKGKVKQITSITIPAEGEKQKKQVVYFDERGLFTLKVIYAGPISLDGSSEFNEEKIGELQYFEYQGQQRHGMSVLADGVKASEFVQQWKDETHCTLTYTYRDAPEKSGTMEWLFTNQARLKEIHFILTHTHTGETLFETTSIHQYDAKGYEIQLDQSTLQPYGDSHVIKMVNVAFDVQGNVLQREEYETNGQLYGKTFFDYVYYE